MNEPEKEDVQNKEKMKTRKKLGKDGENINTERENHP